jgi:hypothetical protein
LFRRGDYRNNGHNPEKLSWVLVPVKIISVARKLSKIEELRKEQNCLFRRGEERRGGGVVVSKVTDPKTVLGSSLGEYGTFRDNN